MTNRTLPLPQAYVFGTARGCGLEVDAIKDKEIIKWDKHSPDTLRRGYLVELFEKKGLLNDFVKEHWPNVGETKLRLYRRARQEYEAFLAGRMTTTGEELEQEFEEAAEDQSFAAEADLRDFLAKNLELVEKGLKLYEKDGRDGIEFPVEDGRIDILAVDVNNRLVVIELKLSRGRNRALGQLLYYMGWVDTKLGLGECRGVIIAREISDDLKLAVKRARGVSLFSYTLAVTLEKII